ncbi:IS66 family transposase [Roseateles sp. P5_E7]
MPEMAVLKRLKFAATSERFASALSPDQRSLLEEALDADTGELGGELAR